jgi:circadian clock protein KaiC
MADQSDQQADRAPRKSRLRNRDHIPPKLSTGQIGLDQVLAGGIPNNALYIVSGPPGAGKTILAQQIAFTAAKAGLNVIYFTNVSEPHAKLVEHIRLFDFFQEDVLGHQINLYNIGSQIRDKGFQATLDFIIETVRTDQADLVVIDSFRGLKHALEITPRERGAIFDLAARLSIISCTSLLIGEYADHELQTDPEFAIADGIINLRYATHGMQDWRTLRVVKMRGVRYLGGEHSFTIEQQGIVVYPRQESLRQDSSYRAVDERVSIGLPGVDALLHGGLLRSSSLLLAGSAGTGKTMLSMHFLAAGAAQGERGLLVSFQENAQQLRRRAQQFGLSAFLSEPSLIEIMVISPVELNIDAAAAQIRERVLSGDIQRVVIDSLAELESATMDIARFDDYLASLVQFFYAQGLTTVLTREIPEMFGSSLSLSSRGLSYIVDTIILLRYVELNAFIRRVITVLKSRGSDHDHSVVELIMQHGAVQLGQRFEHLAGVLSGLPYINGGGQDPASQTSAKE